MNIIFVIILILCIFFYFRFIRKMKVPKTNSVTLVSGGVKCGKSTFAVNLVLKNYKQRLRSWRIRRFLHKLIRKDFNVEKPLLYSNVPLNCDYYEVTLEHLLRKVRFNFGSVIYLQESSFVADSLLIKDNEVNKQLQLFIKLFGHSTHGGLLVLDTHTINDNHFSIKRGISEYFYIHHLVRIPFFLIAYVREVTYSDDNFSIVNVFNDDTEESLKRVLLCKKVWKMFDTYSFSKGTDNLKVVNNKVEGKGNSLKATKMVSFRSDFNIDFEVNNESEKEKE